MRRQATRLLAVSLPDAPSSAGLQPQCSVPAAGGSAARQPQAELHDGRGRCVAPACVRGASTSEALSQGPPCAPAGRRGNGIGFLQGWVPPPWIF
eukprot:COSAG03_NODE_2737_length_2489_cov_2.719247_1_plen_94_part_10